MSTITCNICGYALPEDQFNKDRIHLSGKTGRCKSCEAQYKKKYCEEHRDRIEKYKLENRERILANKRLSYQKNKEHCREYSSAWRAANKERSLRNIKLWREGNKDYHRKYARVWRKAHPERVVQQLQKRRAKKEGLLSSYTPEEWVEAKNYFDNRCAYCGSGTELTQDHFIPLSAGGEYTINNIIPSCRSCNCRKSKSDFFEWYEKQPFFMEMRKKRILKYLNYVGEVQQLKMNGEFTK